MLKNIMTKAVLPAILRQLHQTLSLSLNIRLCCGVAAIVFLGTLVSSNVVFAADPFPLPLFEKSRVVYQTDAQDDDYLLALGQIEKVNGEWQVELGRRLQGELSRATLELTNGHHPQEAYRFYRNLMAEYDARLLFACDGWGCGSSNTWANEHFNVRILSGEDAEQKYAAFEYTRHNQRYVLTLYTVLRGNKRGYVQLDVLRLPAGDKTRIEVLPEAVVQQLRDNGVYHFSSAVLEGTVLTLDVNEKAAVVKALKIMRQIDVAVVVESFQSGTFTELLAITEVAANQLKDDLVSAGVPDKRLQAFGTGNLVPKMNVQQSSRVSLVAGRR